jgi:hypothetical protein
MSIYRNKVKHGEEDASSGGARMDSEMSMAVAAVFLNTIVARRGSGGFLNDHYGSDAVSVFGG